MSKIQKSPTDQAWDELVAAADRVEESEAMPRAAVSREKLLERMQRPKAGPRPDRHSKPSRPRFDPYAEAQKTHPAECDFLRNYFGYSTFFPSLRDQLERTGSLSDKQWSRVAEALKGQTPTRTTQQPTSLPKPRAQQEYTLKAGEILLVSKFLAQRLGNEFALTRPHFALEVLEVLGESLKAYHVRVALSAQRTSHCCICGQKLTNPESVLRGIGPICGGFYQVKNIEELLPHLRIRTEATLWVPKSQVKERLQKVEVAH